MPTAPTHSLSGVALDKLKGATLKTLRGWIESTDSVVTDTTANITSFGDKRLAFGVDGSWTVDGLPETGNTDFMPVITAHRVVFQYLDDRPGSRLTLVRSNWFQLTADSDFKDVVEANPTSVDNQLILDIYGARDDAAASAATAEAAAGPSGTAAQKSANLGDLTDPITARVNLGLAAAAVKGVATTGETVTGTATDRLVTPAGVKAAVDALINGSPGALDTLNELATALGDDANFAATTALAFGNIRMATRAVTAATTAADGEFIEVDATAAVRVVTGPAAGAKRWGVKKVNGTSTAPGNKVTISYLNSAGATTSLDLTLAGESKVFRPSGAGYRVESGDTPRAGLDYAYAGISRTAKRAVGQGELVLNFADYNPVSSTGTGGNIAANNSAASALMADLANYTQSVFGQANLPRVVFPPGYFRLDPGLLDFTTIRALLVGSGENATVLARTPDTTGDLVRFGMSSSGLRHLCLDGASTYDASAGTPGDLLVVNAPSCQLHHFRAVNAPRDALALGRDAGCVNTRVAFAEVRDAVRYGANLAAGTGNTDTEWGHVSIGRSGLSAFRLDAAAPTLEVCHAWGSGVRARLDLGSTDYDGYRVGATGARLVNCEGETNLGAGASFRTGAHRPQVVGGRYWGNVRQGLYATGADHGVISGSTLAQNGVTNTAGSTTASAAGCELNNAAAWVVGANKGQDFSAAILAGDYTGLGYTPANPYPGRVAGSLTQSRHFVETGTTDYTAITGNGFRGADSRSGTGIVTIGTHTVAANNVT